MSNDAMKRRKIIKQHQQKNSMLLLVRGNSTEHWKEKCSIFSTGFMLFVWVFIKLHAYMLVYMQKRTWKRLEF